jgi:hypothetical protein
MRGPDGNMVSYNGFDGYSPTRTPAPVNSPHHENDSILLAYRVTIISGALDPSNDVSGPVVIAPHPSPSSGGVIPISSGCARRRADAQKFSRTLV